MVCLTGAVASLTLAVVPASTAAAQLDPGECDRVPGVSDRCPAWLSERFVSSDGADTLFPDIAASPDGGRVFEALTSQRGLLQVVAYQTDTGAIAWSSVGEIPEPLREAYPLRLPNAVTVSPDGSRVYVVGEAWWYLGCFNVCSVVPFVLAFDADTGEQVWSATFDEPAAASAASVFGEAKTVTVSPDGRQVYVGGFGIRPEALTGPSTAPFTAQTLAYDADSGEILWRSSKPRDIRIAGYGGSMVRDIALAPDGSRVYVTILENDSLTSLADDSLEFSFGVDPLQRATEELSVVAYDTATGKQVWEYRSIVHDWRTSPSNVPRGSIAVSPDGSRVFVAGKLRKTVYLEHPADGLILSLDAADGQLVWERRHFESQPCGEPTPILSLGDTAVLRGLSPDGRYLYTSGRSCNNGRYAVVVYDADTGETVRTFETPVDHMVMSPDATQLYVSRDDNPGTILAYDTATGERLWAAWTGAPAASGMVSEDGDFLYVLRGGTDRHIAAFHTGAAEVALAMAESVDTATTGQPLTYSFTVSSAGPDAALGVTLRVVLPEGVRFVSADLSRGTCAGTATMTCELGDLDSGQNATVEVVVVPESPGTILITGSVSTRSHDPNPDDNHVSEDTQVEAA